MKYIYISIFFILNLFISNNVIADQSVIKELQKGGKIVFIRHSLAPGNGDPDNIDLKKCDCIFAIVNGTPPDEGVMIELGIAIALKKKIFLFRDDFRNCSDSNQYPLNLMLFLGLPKDNWKQYYFESLKDINSNKKAFVEWAKK